MEDKGFVPLNRKIMNNWVWSDKPFAYGQAWIDLIMMANHSDTKFLLGKELVMAERGSVVTSEMKLADRWGWSKTKVRNFLKLLENDSMIVQKKDRKKTTLSILNYGIYNDFEIAKKPQKNRKKTSKVPQKNRTSTAEEPHKYQSSTDKKPQEYTNNNDNNENNVTMKNNDNNDNNENNATMKQENAKTKVSMCVLNTQIKEEIITRWNELEFFGITPIRGIDGKRSEAVRARMKQYGEDCFFDAIDRIRESDFLQGKNNRGWSIKFDWLIKPNNFTKVIEGNYNDSKNRPINQTAQELNDFYKMANQWSESEE